LRQVISVFEYEGDLNQFLIAGLERVVADIPEDRLNERAPGNGHPPVWVLGHLVVVAEMGLQIFGQRPEHLHWFKIFGPGSSDDVPDAESYKKAELLDCIVSSYPRLCEAARNADPERLGQPHGVALLEGTPIATFGQLTSHILTSHLSFHLAQLSAWRRAAGFTHLF